MRGSIFHKCVQWTRSQCPHLHGLLGVTAHLLHGGAFVLPLESGETFMTGFV